MLGALRHEITFATALKENGLPARWLAVPIVLTSHTYENGKNELSHQDPTMAEALMGETSDVSRVVFPADCNSATATMRTIYCSHGEIWGVVVPKREVPVVLSQNESEQLCRDGALELEWVGLKRDPLQVILTAIGAYQLVEVLKASQRLVRYGVAHRVIYMFEPGRFRVGRNEAERKHLASPELVQRLYPEFVAARVFVGHTRPEPLLGLLRPLDTGPVKTIALGFQNHGGTLDVDGMMFVNRLTWAHCLVAVATVLSVPRHTFLTPIELDALEGKRSPQGVLFPMP
jgi:phosphoketolase